MVNAQSSSAAGLISLLADPDPEIQSYAIEELNEVAPLYWAEISEVVAEIEALSEPDTSSLSPESQHLASLLCSKIYFYLGALGEAVDAALNAGESFGRDAGKDSREFRETIIAQCLDRCIEQRAGNGQVDPRLAGIVESVLEGGKHEGGKLSVGLTLSLRRLDLLEQIYLSSKNPRSDRKEEESKFDDDLLRYVLIETTGGASGNEKWSRDFRVELLHLLLKLFNTSRMPDYTSITQIWLQLDEPALAAQTLKELLGDEKLLEAYQIAFDLADSATQGFLETVVEAMDLREEKEEAESVQRNIRDILSGEKSIRLYLEFLSKNNHSDLLVLKNTKDALEARHSIFHSAVTFANAFAHSGTTSDQFLRDNLDWLGRASNWSMFSATAALGVIHKGSLAKAMTVLGPYLPGQPGQSVAHSSAYSEGGSLYGLGLIHAKHGKEVLDYLKDKLKTHTDEVVQHGAALGLGVAGMATLNDDVYEEIRNILFQDSSVAGEASGYAMGLVMLGSGSAKAVDEMLQYAHETQHEKIIRGLAIGIAFLMYGKAEEADDVIDKLIAEKDSILRYGGMYTIALAYAGTANNKAIRRLLHVAVSDVNDDVRRGAVTALGFVMFRNHTQVPRVVQLLSESYNPHVRHGATLALGISCAGTGLTEAIDLLEPMTKDPIDFVRQGAFVSLAMILIQQTEAQSPKVKMARQLFERVIKDKHEDSLAKFGAAISQGIIDAGGRNVTISMQSKAGTPNMTAIVGMTLFCQFWYWFPLAHCLSLSFTPTAIIGLDAKLQAPVLEFTSNAKPSLFAYPEAYKPPVKETVEKVKTAVLSTTARANARARVREREKALAEGTEAMDMDDKPEIKDEKKLDEEVAKKAAEPSSESLANMSRVTPIQLQFISFARDGRYQPVRPISSITSSPSSSNPASVSTRQKGRKVASSLAEALHSRSGLESLAGGGIVMLRDSKADEEAEYLELNASLDRQPPTAGSATEAAPAGQGESAGSQAMDVDEGPEAEMPAPFEYPFGSEGM